MVRLQTSLKAKTAVSTSVGFLIVIFCFTLLSGLTIVAVFPLTKLATWPSQFRITAVSPEVKKPKYVPGEIIVKFRSEILAKDFKEESQKDKNFEITGPELKNLNLPQALQKIINEDKTISKPVFKGLHQEIKLTGKSEAELNQINFTEISKKRKLLLKTPQNYQLSNVYIFKNIETGDQSLEELTQILSQDPNIEYAEPNYLLELAEAPNDPYYHSTGSWDQSYDDLWGLKKIEVEKAWDTFAKDGRSGYEFAGEGVVVAVIDTGVDYNHEDFFRDEYEVGNTTIDKSGNGHKGTIKGATRVDGKVGGGLAFLGNDWVDVSGISTSAVHTLMAWVKLNSATLNSYRIFDSGNGRVVFDISANGYLRYYDKSWHQAPNNPLKDEKWHHVAAVSTGTNLTLYLDGHKIFTDTILANNIGGISKIGNHYIGGTGYFNGYLDEIKIWNRALSEEEIYKSADLLEFENSNNSLVGWWNFGEKNGVLDPGEQYNIWINKGEDINHNGIVDPADFNNIDDDGNGYIDDILGWDFSGNEKYIEPDNDPLDYNGHGTHGAGTIAAVRNNNKGIIGVAPKAKIMPLKIFPYAYSNITAEAIRYAADNGVRVLSNSWGPSDIRPRNKTIELAIAYAHDLGVVIVQAAGNNNYDVAYYSPANYYKTIAVAAVDHNDQKADFSNYGYAVDVSAPGGDSGSMEKTPTGQHYYVNILSLRATGTDMYFGADNYTPGEFILNSNYYRARGTSMAAPHVAGVAALVASKYPNYSNIEIENKIIGTADDIDNLNSDYRGLLGGRLNVYKALTQVPILKPEVDYLRYRVDDDNLGGSVGNSNLVVEQGEIVELYLTLKNFGRGQATNVMANITTDDPNVTIHNGMSYFGSIQPFQASGSEIENSEPFKFEVSLDKSFFEPITFNLNIESNEGNFTATFKVNLNFKVEQLTFNGSNQMEPIISGNKIIWEDYRNNTRDIYLYDINTGQEKKITALQDRNSTWVYSGYSKDIYGELIVWADYNGINPWDFNIYTQNLIDDSVNVIRRSFNQYFPSIYKNNKSYIIAWRDNWDQNVFVYDSLTKTERPINQGVRIKSIYYPVVSEDKVVWINNQSAFFDGPLYLYDLTANQGRIIAYRAQYPDMADNKVVWTDYRYNIFMYDLENLSYQRITNDNAFQGFPAVSGDKIVWSDLRDGDYNIYMYNLSLGRDIQITNYPTEQSHSDISGNKIVWQDYQNENWDIYMATLSYPLDIVQKMIDEAAPGNTIKIMAGEYRARKDLIINKPIFLEAEGNVIIDLNGNSINIGDASDSNVAIKGFIIKNGIPAIEAINSRSNLTIENCIIRSGNTLNRASDGIAISNHNGSVLIKNNLIYGVERDRQSSTGSNTSAYDGIYVFGSDLSLVTIENNTVYGFSSYNLYLEGEGATVKYNILQDFGAINIGSYRYNVIGDLYLLPSGPDVEQNRFLDRNSMAQPLFVSTKYTNEDFLNTDFLRLKNTDRNPAYNIDGNNNHAGWPEGYSFGEWNITPEPPQAPSNLRSTFFSKYDSIYFDLTWQDNSDNEDGFVLDRKVGDGSWKELFVLEESDIEREVYINYALQRDIPYYHRIKAFNSGGYSDYSNVTSLIIPSELCPPVCNCNNHSVLGDINNDGKINATDADIISDITTGGISLPKNICCIDIAGGVKPGFGNGKVDLNDVLEIVNIYAKGNPQNITGACTCNNDGVCNTRETYENCPNDCIPPPAAPSNLSALAVSTSQINLSWQDNSNNETGFLIERFEEWSGKYRQVGTVSANETTFRDVGLSEGTRFCHRVKAYNAAGDSGYSNTACATTLAPPPVNANLNANVNSNTNTNYY